MTNLLSIALNWIGGILLQIPMADTFRSEGKIYVVLAIVLIILFGLFGYLLRFDKKIKKLEEEIKNK